MAQALRRVRLTPRQIGAQAPLVLLWAGPLTLAFFAVIAAAIDRGAWLAVLAHPQLGQGLALSLFIGTASTLLATLISLYLALVLRRSQSWARLTKMLGAMIALPHFAFSVGLGFLIMPSGLFARLLAIPLGWQNPPEWVTTQDPWGFSLMGALLFKEVPFLLWLMAAISARRDFSQSLSQLDKAGASLGHGSRSRAWRITAPLLLRQLIWPITIVWVYGCSVVDMAIAIGPTQPPPFQLVIWSDLNSAAVANNARGTAGAVLLTMTLAILWLAAWAIIHMLRPALRRALTRGPSLAALYSKPATAIQALFALAYTGTLFVLVLMSFAPHWPFPALAPDPASLGAWRIAAGSSSSLLNSLLFAVATTATSLLLAIVWFELMPRRADALLMGGAVTALAVPSLLLADGLYLAFLPFGLGGTYPGVYLAHLSAVFAYVFIALAGSYRAFDPRYRAVSFGLNATGLRFLLDVKLPLLKPVLLGSAAIGIAVSMAQYVPAQLIAAGRLSTWPIDAVTLASGGARHMLAAFALVMALIPLLAFVTAERLARAPA